MARSGRGRTAKHAKGNKRARDEVVGNAAGSSEEEVPNDLLMRARGASRIRVSTGSDVDVDYDVEEGEEQNVDEPPGGEIKARPPYDPGESALCIPRELGREGFV